jgi:PTH1 family peptidyl-tRNA hydrolase
MQRTLFIGLGNPGEEHAGTYHNAGWELLDFLREKLEKKYGESPVKDGKGFQFRQYGEYSLVYPDTYMNRSGEAVKAALAWFHKQPEETVIFHDDSDLAVGEYKEASGGAAGHHGIESIFETVGDIPLLRVRIGIRDPREKNGDHPRRKAGEFVLKNISKDHKEELNKVFEDIAAKFLSRD